MKSKIDLDILNSPEMKNQPTQYLGVAHLFMASSEEILSPASNVRDSQLLPERQTFAHLANGPMDLINSTNTITDERSTEMP